MLVFDIETTGLDHHTHQITVIFVHDCQSNTDQCFNFAREARESLSQNSEMTATEPLSQNTSKEEFLEMLDNTDIICCFNGVKFDIPFVISFFQVPPQRYQQYFTKVFDYYEYCRLLFDTSCSLNNLLKANGHAVKTSSGGQAVLMAEQGRWQELEDYCKQDTLKTRDLCKLAKVLIPLRNKRPVLCQHNWQDTQKHSMCFLQAVD